MTGQSCRERNVPIREVIGDTQNHNNDSSICRVEDQTNISRDLGNKICYKKIYLDI